MSGKVIAIHQPNFFPWLGFFSKLKRADEFVYLNHVKNNVKDGSWFKRVKILNQGKEMWITVPLNAEKGNTVFQEIMEMEIKTADKHFRKLFPTIKQIYCHSPFFKEVIPLVETFFEQDTLSLSERNIMVVELLKEKLQIETKTYLSSDYKWQENSTNLLIEICKHFHATAYLSGDGADGYMIEAEFAESSIALEQMNFKSPVYPQFNSNDFIPGLSILDALFNLGFKRVRELL